MLWEVERGRSCDSLRLAQVKLIHSQGLELVSTGEELRLCKVGSLERDSLVTTAKEGQAILTKQFVLDLNTEKKKVKKWRRVAVIETVAVVLGLIILL